MMCHCSTTSAILISLMSWAGDCICIDVARSKSDQTGEKEFPRHIYANPYMPWVCPFLYVVQYTCFASHLKILQTIPFFEFQEALKRSILARTCKALLKILMMSLSISLVEVVRKTSEPIPQEKGQCLC